MHSVRVTREIAAPVADVWEVLDDFGGVANYNPNVDTSRIVAGPERGTGATRECVFDDGGRIEEEIVDYEAESRYTVEFTDVGDFPLRENVVDIAVESVDDSRTRVTMAASFVPKYGPVGWLMAKAMVKSRFEATFEEVLEGLDAYVQSREPVASD